MSKEHFNGSSNNNLAIIVRLLPLTLLLVMGAFLMFYDKTLQVSGPWGTKSFGIAMAFIAAVEMISYQQRLRFNTPPSSPVPSDKTKYNQIAIIVSIIVFSGLLGYTVAAIRNKPEK